MAKHYQFWYNVEEAWRASFTADSLEEAKALLEQVEAGDLSLDELPNYYERNKGLDTTIDMPSLEFLGDFDVDNEEENDA
jgi:hypothetical protein